MSHPWRKPLSKDAVERWRSAHPAQNSAVATSFLKDATAKAIKLRQRRQEVAQLGGKICKLRFDERNPI